MKLSFKLYRCVSIPKSWFPKVLGLPESAPDAKLEEELRKQRGPLSPRVSVWWSADRATIGIEALGFDLHEQSVPCGGVCSTDPMCPQDVDHLDGALEGEIDRWGMVTDFIEYEWRAWYKLSGQEDNDGKACFAAD